METKDLPKLKHKMEQEILVVIQNFEEESGLRIKEIEFIQLRMVTGGAAGIVCRLGLV